jgi:hypothetical protein
VNKAVFLTSVFFLGWCCVGQSALDKVPDAVVKDMLALIKKATGILAGITNEKEVKAASPKLKRIGRERKTLGARYKKLNLSKEEEAQLKKKYGDEVKTSRRKLETEINRVSKIPGGPEALKLLDPRESVKEK